METHEALEIVAGMAHLIDFPYSPEAKANLAEMLMELTGGNTERARWLVREVVDGNDRYPGPRTIKEIYWARYPPSGSLYAPTRPLGEEPVFIECRSCNDFGFVFNPSTNAHEWCPEDCSVTRDARRDQPQFIASLNDGRRTRGIVQKLIKDLPRVERPVTNEDIERARAEYIARKERIH